MPSFDIVSEVDQHELSNAVDQTSREISTRFDFKGADAKIEHEGEALNLEAETDFQLRQIKDILIQKASKRGINVGCLEYGKVEEFNRRARQKITVKQGIDQALGKQIIKLIKDSKLKVQAAFQGDQVRVTGKKRDDLQEVIALLRGAELDLPLQYINFRD